jgi:hypothetical protein
MERCGAQIVNNISPSLAFIEKRNREQVTRSFVETVPTIKGNRSERRAIAITAAQCAARELFVEAITSVLSAITN